jgi:NAD-dependent deacetylase
MSGPAGPIRLDPDTWLLVSTGAGVSAESGIPTFRGSDGLWEGHRVEDVASPDGFRRDPALVWRFYSLRRKRAVDCAPNPGHRALARVEERLRDRFLLVTQNVDDLHRRAGSQRIVELHGNLFVTRCSHCHRPPFRDERAYEAEPPTCSECGKGLLRPHIVWFGEMLDPAAFERIEGFLRAALGHRLVFLAVGTSGLVYPAAALVDLARAQDAETWLVNAEPAENVGRFERFVRGQSGRVLPELLAVVEEPAG